MWLYNKLFYIFKNGKFHSTVDLFIFLELAGLHKLNEQQFYLFGQIQTIQTGGQPYSDTSPSVSVLWLNAKNQAVCRLWIHAGSSSTSYPILDEIKRLGCGCGVVMVLFQHRVLHTLPDDVLKWSTSDLEKAKSFWTNHGLFSIYFRSFQTSIQFFNKSLRKYVQNSIQ